MTTKIALALALAITALASVPASASPNHELAGGKQLPGGFGIRPNLGLGLRLNDKSEHQPRTHLNGERP